MRRRKAKAAILPFAFSRAPRSVGSHSLTIGQSQEFINLACADFQRSKYQYGAVSICNEGRKERQFGEGSERDQPPTAYLLSPITCRGQRTRVSYRTDVVQGDLNAP